MDILLRPAAVDDLSAIVALMNAAFRGSEGQQGWNTEAEYITGSRTTESLLLEEIAGGVQVLVVDSMDGVGLDGCVSLKVLSSADPARWYLGSLAVRPTLQNSGYGRAVLEAAEGYAAQRGALAIEITVVNIREALLAWYERRGYRLTGEARPFPYGDDRFGMPLRDDLEFVVLEKWLG